MRYTQMNTKTKLYLDDKTALDILTRDNPYQKTSIQFDYALRNAIEALKYKIADESMIRCCPLCGTHIKISDDNCTFCGNNTSNSKEDT